MGRDEFLSNFPAGKPILKTILYQSHLTLPLGPVHLPHLYPLVQHMVGKASAAIFAGTKLASIPEVVESFKNITTEVGAEIAIDSVFLERYWGLNRFRMWYVFITMAVIPSMMYLLTFFGLGSWVNSPRA